MGDKDGLISIKGIETINNGGNITFKLNKKEVNIHKRSYDLIFYVFKNLPELYEECRILLTDIQNKKTISGSAKIFGIGFEKALEKINSPQTIRLYCEKKNDLSTQGVVAEMLVHIHNTKDGKIGLQVRQGVTENEETFYCHGIISNNAECSFSHFDCALINLSIENQELLFKESKKIKGDLYTKVFRIDGNIKKEDIINLMRIFFPLDNLIDEYFIEKI